MQFDLTTVAGLAAATAIVVQIILTAAAPSDAASSRWGPLLALGVAIVLSVLQAASVGTLTGATALQLVLQGLFAGATAMGAHNVATKSAVGATVATALGIAPAMAPAVYTDAQAAAHVGDGSGR